MVPFLLFCFPRYKSYPPMNTKRHARILIVEDDEDDFIILSRYIRNIPALDAELTWCSTYSEALEDMCAHRNDLYFVDYRLGARSGVDLLKEAMISKCENPIILLTGKGNYQVDFEAMQLGAVDYLVKTDLNSEKVDRCIRYALERASVMKALSANERKFRSIFEKSRDIIFTADNHLRFIDVNPAIADFLGYTQEQAQGMNLSDLIDRAQHRKYFVQTLRSGNNIKDWEVQLLTAKGEYKTCIITASREIDSDNSEYIQGIIHDITNIKKAEKATLKMEKLAMVGRLAHTLAHEIRNPLNNITLSLEQMMEFDIDESLKSYHNIISRNSQRINDLIKQLLSSSQPMDIQLKVCPVQSVIDEVIAAAIDRITLKKIKLELNYPPDSLFIAADRDKLNIALLNILINAVEAMEEGSGRLSININATGEEIIVAITDNGSGISPEHIAQLFEPYFTQKRNGVGLGLALTLNILQAHKATVEAISEPGVYTTFLVAFPVISS